MASVDDLEPGAVLEGMNGEQWLVNRRSWVERGGDEGERAQLVLELLRLHDA